MSAMSDLETDFVEVEVRRQITEWYTEFDEIWTCSVAVDARNPAGQCRYSVRVVGPNGEACKESQLEPESVPTEVRDKFRSMFSHAKGEV